MAESPIEKLKRLKLEREQKNDQLKQSSTLEAVQEPTGDSQHSVGAGTNQSNSAGTGTTGSADTTTGTTVSELPVEVSVSSSVSDPDSSSVAEVKPLEVKAEPAAKPMTAMERLRALKSGSSKPDSSTAASLSNVATDAVAVVVPSKPLKPRSTHPIAMEMAELEAALDAQVPGFVSILSTIHKKLKVDPNVVTLLDDEEIAVIVAGLEKHTNVTIVAPSAVKAAKSKARKEPVGAGDL